VAGALGLGLRHAVTFDHAAGRLVRRAPFSVQVLGDAVLEEGQRRGTASLQHQDAVGEAEHDLLKLGMGETGRGTARVHGGKP
jgi:hypothetical protein